MYIRPQMAAVALGLGFLVTGCVTNDSGQTAHVGSIDTGQTAVQDTQGSQPRNNAQPDTSTPETESRPKDDRLAIACGQNIEEGKVGEAYLGAPCEEHSDCETGFCYDGKFLGWEGGFKFCTFACGGCSTGSTPACADFDVMDGPSYKCIRLPSCHVDEHPVREFCVPGCQGSNGMANCNDWFESGTYQVCEIPKTNDCGGIGASKVCFVPEP